MERGQRIAEAFAESHGVAISACFRASEEHYRRKHDDEPGVLGKRSKASCFSDYVWKALRIALAENRDFRFPTKESTRFIVYRDVLVMRVRKRGSGRRPAKNHTLRESAFDRQQRLFPDARVNAYLVYDRDELTDDISHLALVCPDFDHIRWVVDVMRSRTPVLELPAVAHRRPRSDRVRVVNRENTQGGASDGGRGQP